MIAVLALSATLASSPASCESLKSLSLPNTTIVAAEMVPAGPYTPPGRGGAPAAPAAEGRGRGGRRAISAAADCAGALPRERDPASVAGFGHRDGSVAAGKLERQVSVRRRRRMGRHHQLPGDGERACRKATRPPRPTPATRAATRSSRSTIRRRWSTSPIAPCTRRRCRPKALISDVLRSRRRGSRTGTAARPADGRA